MKNKAFILVSFIIILTGLLISLSLFQSNNITQMDSVAVNELVKQTEQNWDFIKKDANPELHFSTEYDYTIMDKSGSVIFSTYNKEAASYSWQINEAIKNRDTMLDLIVNGEVVGKLIIKNELSSRIEAERAKIRKSIFISFLFISVMLLGYLIYLERKIFRPFYLLKQFAERIAAGNLDIPVKMDKNNVFGAFTESFDLMREALKTARYNEYLANKSKKELVASLSHDIKNPVASIKAICETMALNSDDRHIITIRQKAEQVDSLINDMFQSTLEELGELKVKTEEFSSAILLEMIENANYDHKIEIISTLPECILLCDKLRLTQIIDNIIGNSYKYAESNIHISFRLTKNNLQISIKDFGRGILEEELPLVWEKFYRGKNAEGKEGAGLGLYLSKYFIEKMGGQIECLNEADGFIVRLELKLAGNQT